MTLRVALRCDASVTIGTGHVMRCLALADALSRQGADVAFVMRDLPGNMIAKVKAAGHKILQLPAPDGPSAIVQTADHATWSGVPTEQDAGETRSRLGGRQWDWLIVDHYSFDRSWQVKARPADSRLMVIDDLADRSHDCDLLLDQTLGRIRRDYTALISVDTRCLIGPRFALLRPDFAALRPAGLAARGQGLHHVLVAMGGIDAPNVTARLLRALPQDLQVTVVMGSGAPALPEVRALAAKRGARLVVDTPAMAALMVEADLAIGGVGGGAWERCALGLPTLMVVMAENQAPAAAALAATGAARLIGRADDPALPAGLLREIASLSDGAALKDMAHHAAAVCDGRGLPRVLHALTAPRLHLRRARPEDGEVVWHWRKALAGSSALRKPEVTSLGAHMDWFTDAVSQPSRRLYIAETDSPIGHLRLDDAEKPGSARVSILLDPSCRGAGLGSTLLAAAETEARKLGLNRLEAEVHADNAASMALFRSAGYGHQVGPDSAFRLLELDL